MKVRLANKFDLPIVLDMLRNFRNPTPIDIMRECNNEEYINKLFHHVILGGGIALIAEDKDVAGMIIGVKDQNVWDPEVKVLRELVYWVEPQYRGSTAGYKLLLRYNKLAQELVDEQKINMYTMTKMVNSPDLDFSRFGYKKTEEVWVAGV
jgi:N-acetylglutamate synthase-like GNAT family acetyltransferase